MQFDGGGVFADFLDGSDLDKLAVDFDALFLEGLGNLDSVYGTEYGDGLAGLGADGECFNFVELCGQSFGLSLINI